jgi:hypothetical protein
MRAAVIPYEENSTCKENERIAYVGNELSRTRSGSGKIDEEIARKRSMSKNCGLLARHAGATKVNVDDVPKLGSHSDY